MDKASPTISFASDNHAGIYPPLLAAITRINEEWVPGYDQDQVSKDLFQKLNSQLGDFHLAFAGTGTAANTLTLASHLESFEAVLATSCSYQAEDSCGALEKFHGAKVIGLDHFHGKLQIESLKLALSRRGDQHHTQAKVVSITQPTELGTVYSLPELKALRDFCDNEGLLLHIDGARLILATALLECDLKGILDFADTFTLGGAKMGLLFGEMVGMRSKTAFHKFRYLRKQGMNLFAKTRFVAAQFETLLGQGTYREFAKNIHGLTQHLAGELSRMGFAPVYPVESCMIFMQCPRPIAQRLRKDFFFYHWDPSQDLIRLVISWQHSENDIQSFLSRLREIKENHS